MSFAPLGNVNLTKVYQEANILKLKSVHSLEIGKFTYKEKFGYLPTKIGNYFPTSSNYTDHNYGTRVSTSTIASSNKIVYRLESSVKSVQYRSDTLWSALPDHFKTLETINIFKNQYKKHLIASQ